MRAPGVLVVLAACSFRAPASGTDVPPLDTPAGADAPGDGSAGMDALTDALAADAGVDAPDATVRRCATTYPVVGTHRYKVTSNGSWMATEAECELADAHLVKIDNALENTAVVAYLASGAYTWIGLRDPGPTDGVYVWTDATSPYKAPSGTETSTNSCVDLGSAGGWFVYDCGYANQPGLCECD